MKFKSGRRYHFLPRIFFLLFVAVFLSLIVKGQEKRDPDRGFIAAGAYALSNIETINTTNGNLMLNMPLASLPAGRATSPGFSFNLSYNSKLWDSKGTRITDGILDETSEPHYFNAEEITASENAGWQYSYFYKLELTNRNNLEPLTDCNIASPDYEKKAYIWKLRMRFPDGSVHEFRPAGRTDLYGDGYFKTDPNGRTYAASSTNCVTDSQEVTTGMSYYSTDGSFLRLVVDYVPGNNGLLSLSNPWTLYFPDGGKVVNPANFSSLGYVQRVYDRNNNYVQLGNSNGNLAEDEFGRGISIETDPNDSTKHYIKRKGVDGEILTTTVKWKTVWVRRKYDAAPEVIYCNTSRHETELLTSLDVVDYITLPAQIGGLTYTFDYNGSATQPTGSNYTTGWGELKQIVLPSGAQADYEYVLDSVSGTLPSPFNLLQNSPVQKDLTYLKEYDGTSSQVTESWEYSIGSNVSTITGPDGGVTTQWFGDTWQTQGLYKGLVYKETHPNGTIVERIWQSNAPENVYYASEVNAYVKTEFVTITDASGTAVLTSIKDYGYDKNGNVTEVKEYDWMPYANINRDSYGKPTGIPTSAAGYLKRITATDYYNPTPDAASTTYTDSDSYHLSSNPRLLKLAKSSEVRDGANNPKTRSEIYYDHTDYASSNTKGGNPVETKNWDSFKGGSSQTYSNPLTSTNSISTSVVYDQYGNPTLTTDAKGNQTQITYGSITTPTGTVSDLYPTQTVAAYGTSIAQTTTAVYDFYTGLVTQTIMLGNTTNENVTTATEYDALGRPTKTKAAVGTPLEIWTQTEYDDINRRIITRSDLEVKGDGKKIAVQHFDQLGRVRLSRKLENPATENPTDETHGIKVQTRYKYTSDGEYVLISNPYRAATSALAGNEPTMGWKVEFESKDGDLSTTEIFSGTSLPAPWGNNPNSTGIGKTEEDANATIVTDEAGKKRRTIEDALGRLIRVDEPDENNDLGSVSSPVQPTNYSYDTLGNLIQVVQGEQTRLFTYGSLSQLLSATNPESGTFQYTYDNNGNLLTKTDARGVSTAYTYDALNRVTLRNYSDSTPDISYFYDDPNVPFSNGKLTKVSSSVSETLYTAFDADDNVLSSRQITDGQIYDFGYTYNLNGDLLTQTYPSGKVVKYDYSNDGDLAQVSNFQTQKVYANSFGYTAHGQVEKLRLGNGKWETTKFNSSLQITEIGLGHSATDTGLWKTNYEYGEWENEVINQVKNNGNLARQTITVPTIGTATGFTAVQVYDYDKLDRLKSATETVSGVEKWKQAFNYDRFGNKRFNMAGTTLLSVESNVPKIADPEILPTNNQYKADQDNDGINDYLYDASGNITKNAKDQTFTYDAENRQTTAVGSNLSMSYAYDGNDKRVKTFNAITNQTTVFVYDASGDLAAEYTINVPAPQNPTISYLTEDALGSVRVVTNSFGEIKARRDFLPFGEELFAGIGNRNLNQKYSANADDTRKKFATYQRDVETGLDYAQSRYYSPMQGRFTSPDEFKGGPDELFDFEEDASDNPTFYADLENPQSLNKYQYTYNNPYKYNDPTGHCPPAWICAAQQSRPLLDALARNAERVLQGAAVIATTVAAANAGSTEGDPSCRGCTSSQRMGQSLMNKNSNSGNKSSQTQGQANTQASGSMSGGLGGGNKNLKRGRDSEKRVLKSLKQKKNTKKVSTKEGNSIPDFQNKKQIGEIKDTKKVSNTKQMRIQRGAARKTKRQHVVVTGKKTRVSKPMQESGSKIIRRDDLGPRQ